MAAATFIKGSSGSAKHVCRKFAKAYLQVHHKSEPVQSDACHLITIQSHSQTAQSC